jgi:predicted component of type VI protein secretion system
MTRIIADPNSGRVDEYVLEQGEYLIGQGSQCDIRLSDRTASRRHARISFQGSRLTIEDLGSTNGTFLRDRRIDNAEEVTTGTLKIGSCKVVVVVDEQKQSDHPKPARLRVAVLYPQTTQVDSYFSTETREITARDVPAEIRNDAAEEILNRAEITDPVLLQTEQALPDAAMGTTSDSHQPLSVGTWIEFSGDRAAKRVLHLLSISKQGGVYFFGDDQTDETTLCVTATRLSERLQERSARILS